MFKSVRVLHRIMSNNHNRVNVCCFSFDTYNLETNKKQKSEENYFNEKLENYLKFKNDILSERIIEILKLEINLHTNSNS